MQKLRDETVQYANGDSLETLEIAPKNGRNCTF